MAFNPDKCLKIINKYNGDNWVSVHYDSDALPTIYFSKTGEDGTWVADGITLRVGESAYIKGTGPTAISDETVSVITTLGPYDLSGQITSLLNDGEGGDVPLTRPYCFARLFIGFGNPRVINIAQDMFPSTVLSPYCYSYMFSTTETLETPKPIILPAENLVEGCYYYMFNKSYKVTKLQVNFKDWNQAPHATENWTRGITTTGVLYCPDELPLVQSDSAIPATWSKQPLPTPTPTEKLFKKKMEKDTNVKFVFLNMNDETDRTKLIPVLEDTYSLPSELPFPIVPGSEFKGWSLTPFGAILPMSTPISLTGNIYLYARYDILLTLSPGDGTGEPIVWLMDQTPAYSLPTNVPTFTPPYNTTFGGWKRYPNQPKISTETIPLLKSMTLYATWETGMEGWVQLIDYPSSTTPVSSTVKIHEYNDSSKVYICNGMKYIYNRFWLTGIPISATVNVSALPPTADADKIYALMDSDGNITYWHYEYDIIKSEGGPPMRADGTYWTSVVLVSVDTPLINNNGEETFYLKSSQRIYYYNFISETWELQNTTKGEIIPYAEIDVKDAKTVKTPENLVDKFFKFSKVVNGYTHYCFARLVDTEHYQPPRPVIDPYIYWLIDNQYNLWISAHPLISNNKKYEGKFPSDWQGSTTGTDGPWKDYKDNIITVNFLEDIAPKNVSHWFDYFQNLKSFSGLEHFRTDYAQDWTSAFAVPSKKYGSLELDLSQLNTDSARIFKWVFTNAKFVNCDITSIDLSGWNTSNVTSTELMFDGCPKIQHIYVGDGWDMSHVTNSTNMFGGCTSLHNWNGTTNRTKAIIDDGTNGGYLERKEVVYFEPNGGRGIPYKKYVLKNTTISLTECQFAPAKERFTFLGWSTSTSKDDIIHGDSLTITKDITLYAIWSENT